MPQDKALKTIQKAWERAEKVQQPRNEIYLRLYQRYKGYNPNITDAYRSNLVMPKLYTAIESITPRIAKALFGKRPYIPIRSEINPNGVKPIEDALDSYLYKDKFKIKGAQLLKAVGLFGTSFIEALPVKVGITERRMEQSPVYPWNDIPRDVTVPRFRLDIRRYMPWQVYVEPNMLDLDSPGWAIIVEITPKSEILRMIAEGKYRQISEQELNSMGDTEEAKNFSKNMMQSLNITVPDEDIDYGVLMRFQSKDEYITNWNGYVTLAHSDNPFNHKKINVTRCVWNLDPMLQNSFWGQPEGKACEAIMDKLDESWNMTFDNNDIINQAVLAYREDAVNREDTVFVGGSRIPIKQGFQGNLKEAVGILETRGLPAEAFAIPATLDREVDRTMGNHPEHRGEDSPGTKTATESSILANQGDLRNEHRAEIIEALGLGDLADKCTSHIDQFAAMDDLIEVIGERALETSTMNPHLVPGGFDYQFKGSESVINDFQKRADLRANLDLMGDNPAIIPPGIARISFRTFGFSEQEIKETVMSDEQFYGMMQQQQQAQDEERVKDLVADVIRSDADAEAKARNAPKDKPSGKTGDKKKQKAVQRPSMGNPKGGKK